MKKSAKDVTNQKLPNINIGSLIALGKQIFKDDIQKSFDSYLALKKWTCEKCNKNDKIKLKGVLSQPKLIFPIFRLRV